jgi:hypothetical protein
VSAPSAICVNDDLTAGKTSIALWTTNDKKTGRLNLFSTVSTLSSFMHSELSAYVVNSFIVKELCRDDLLDNLLLNLLS